MTFKKLSILTDEATLNSKVEHELEDSSPANRDNALTPDAPDVDMDQESDEDSLFDSDSLFDEPMADSPSDVLPESRSREQDDVACSATYAEPPPPSDLVPAQRTAPPIPGLYFDPFVLLPDELAEDLLQKCIDAYFQEDGVNQVMLFERVVTENAATDGTPVSGSGSGLPATSSGIPSFLRDLLAVLSETLRPTLPPATHALLFPPPGTPARARQVIINFYNPGEGITPHVDLLDRFGDGIIGVSLGSGCVMRFNKVEQLESAAGAQSDADRPSPLGRCDHLNGAAWDVFLPHGSVYVMSDEARYGWTHGIDGRMEDWVRVNVESEVGRWVMRSIRVSITFRWLLPGADVVGGLAEPTSQY